MIHPLHRATARWVAVGLLGTLLVAPSVPAQQGPRGADAGSTEGRSGTPAVPVPAPSNVPSNAPPSGYAWMSPALRAMQDDDSANPGMLWVEEGRARWAQREGPASRACADCHGPTLSESMRGVAARHPAWDAVSGRPVTLAERIAACRSRHQGLPAIAAPSGSAGSALLALETAVAHASRGLPMSPPHDPRLAPWRERGRALWQQRIGQLDLSCAECHDDRAGGRLGGSVIPPGHAAGYPTYRLEWQTLDGVTRRIRNCTTGVRAQAWPDGSDELRSLQVWMAWRERGLRIETPAVRP